MQVFNSSVSDKILISEIANDITIRSSLRGFVSTILSPLQGFVDLAITFSTIMSPLQGLFSPVRGDSRVVR